MRRKLQYLTRILPPFLLIHYDEFDYSTFKHLGLSLKDITKLQGLCVSSKVTPAFHRLSHVDVKRLCHTQRMCVHERHTAAVCVRVQKETENRQT